MRALRIELRRSVAAKIMLVLVVIGVADLFWGGSGSPAGGWAAMTYTQRGITSLLWPLALGAGAWQARREQIAGVDELFTTSPRTPAQRLAPVAVALGWAVFGAYILLLLIGSLKLMTTPADVYLTPNGVAAVLVGALSLVTAAWLGLFLGRLIRWAFAPPLLTVLGLAVITLVDELDLRLSGTEFSLLFPALDAPYQQDFVELPLAFSGQQALWLVALAITAFTITTAVRIRGRLLALVPAVAAGLVVFPLLPSSGALMNSAVYAADAEAMKPVCTPDAPKVCVMRVHAGLLDEVTEPARKGLAALAFLPDAPTSVSEVSEGSGNTAYRAGWQPVPGTVAMTIYLNAQGHVEEPEMLPGTILSGAGTTSCSGAEWSDEQRWQNWVAEDVVGAWLAKRAGLAYPPSPWPEKFDPMWNSLTALPDDLQRRRIVEYRADAARCPADLPSRLVREQV